MRLRAFIIGIILVSLISCTDNIMTRKFGGAQTIKIPSGEKLVNVTWKDTDLWILTTDREEGEEPKNYYFQEDSSFGILEGTIIFEEQ